MRTTFLVAAVAAFSTPLFAFPAFALEAAQRAARDPDIAAAAKTLYEQRSDAIVPDFNAAQQLIDVSGAHTFVPPGSGDLRGPCPGLNAMANHNYLPHNGFATIDQFISATNKVFGMGVDIATILSIYGTVMDGNPLGLTPGWSIGGPPTTPESQNLLGNLLGLLGRPDGISGSHNKYEADASPTRGDLYQYGEDYLLKVSQFQALFDLQPDPASANYDINVMAKLRKITFERSIAQNPHFWYGPVNGILASNAAHLFVFRFMGNKSAEHPDGYLNQDVLKTFYSVTGTTGNFNYTPGYERIPENWYTRAAGDEYSLVPFFSDVLFFASQYPNSISIGGNTGSVNSFAPLNFDNITGGVYNIGNLLQGNNLACFVFTAATLGAPDFLKGIYADVAGILSPLTSAVGNVLSGLSCPQLQAIDSNQFRKYPGYGF